MANHVSHAALPYPIKNARFTVNFAAFDVNADLINITSPVSRVSLDAAALATTAEAVSNVTDAGSYLTLTGAETNCSLLKLVVTSSNGKPVYTSLSPRVLPVLLVGIADAGSAGSITFPTNFPHATNLYIGNIIKTTGGTAGGGTGGANNQARVVTSYNGATRVATVVPNWEGTPPDNTTTFEVLQTEFSGMTGGEAVIMFGLDHLIGVAGSSADVADNSLLARIVSKSTPASFGSFVNTDEALEALRDYLVARLASLTFTGTNVHSSVEAGTLEAVLTETAADFLADAYLPPTARLRQERALDSMCMIDVSGGAVNYVEGTFDPPMQNVGQFYRKILSFDKDTPTLELRGLTRQIATGGTLTRVMLTENLPVAPNDNDEAIIS